MFRDAMEDIEHPQSCQTIRRSNLGAPNFLSEDVEAIRGDASGCAAERVDESSSHPNSLPRGEASDATASHNPSPPKQRIVWFWDRQAKVSGSPVVCDVKPSKDRTLWTPFVDAAVRGKRRLRRMLSSSYIHKKEELWWDWAFRTRLPPWFRRHINFYRLHFCCFLLMILVSTPIMYLLPPGPGGRLSFIDALYNTTSAVCLTGMISVDMDRFSTLTHIFRLMLMVVGSQIFTSLVPVYVRRFYFHRYLYLEGIVTREGRRDESVAEPDDPLDGSTGGEAETADGLDAVREDRSVDLDSNQDVPNQSSATKATESAASRMEAGGKLKLFRTGSLTIVPPEVAANTSLRRDASSVTPVTDNSTWVEPESDRSLHGPGYLSRVRSSVAPAGGASIRAPAGERRYWESPSLAMRHQQQQRDGLTPRRAFGLEDALDRTIGPMSSRMAGGQEAAWHTWSGDVARAEGHRLKLALEILKVQQQQRESDHQRRASMFQRTLSQSTWRSEDLEGSVVAATMETEMLPACPGERRFLELRALETLSWLVPVYFVGVQLLAFLAMLLVVYTSPSVQQVLRVNRVNAVFFSCFQVVSAFTNAGLVLLNSNLMEFHSHVSLLLLLSFLILLGNTMFPPTLRGILMLLKKRAKGERKVVYQYLLDHPRKCYTHLFPRHPTLWLLFTVIAFNTAEFVFYCAFDWQSEALEGFSTGSKLLGGYFQSVSTRNAGYNVVVIALLSPPMLVLYLAMMNISVYPLYLTRQTSREQREVYDDEDIGVFYEDLQGGVLDQGVITQGKKLFLHDTALVFLAIFLVCILETANILDDPSNFSIFSIIFEIMSGYGDVGLSLGYTCPEDAPADCVSPPYSFSGVWGPVSKVVMVLVMLLARHRGLPDNIDAAIVIPDQKQFQATAARGRGTGTGDADSTVSSARGGHKEATAGGDDDKEDATGNAAGDGGAAAAGPGSVPVPTVLSNAHQDDHPSGIIETCVGNGVGGSTIGGAGGAAGEGVDNKAPRGSHKHTTRGSSGSISSHVLSGSSSSASTRGTMDRMSHV